MRNALKQCVSFLCLIYMAVFFVCVAHAETLTLPSSLKVIEGRAFYGDSSIKRVILPTGIERIEEKAFAYSGCIRINLPSTLTYIAPDAFEGCDITVCTGTAYTYAAQYCASMDIPFVPYAEPISSITVDVASLTLKVGETAQLSVKYLPENASYKHVNYVCNNENVTVSTTGLVSAHRVGTSKIDIIAADGSRCRESVTITILEADSITASVSGSGNTRTISVSGNGNWTAKSNADWITLSKTSGASGTSSMMATLTANPSTTASRSGTVTFTCGTKTTTVTITQEKSSIAVTGVSLNKTSAALKIGGTVTLTATIAPSNATNKAVTWSSSNTSVATVSNGTVIGKTAGTATITVKTADASKTATCTVTVYGNPAISFTSYPTSVTTATTGVDIVAKVTGGKGPYTGYWTMYKGGTRENGTNTYTISSNTTNWPINQFGSVGSFQAELTITDALGQTVSAKTGTMKVTVPDTITATASGSGNTRTISVIANGSWTAKSNVDWISLSKTSGSSGTSSVTATLKPNPSATASRSGTITFTRGSKTATVTIIQAKPIAVTSGPEIKATCSGKTVTFSWTSVANADWYALEIYTEQNWNLMLQENGTVARYHAKIENLSSTTYTTTLDNGSYVAYVAAGNAASWRFGNPDRAARFSIGTTPGDKVAQKALAYYNAYVNNGSIPVSTATDWCARFVNKCISAAGYSGYSTAENVVYQIQYYGTRFHVTYPGAKSSGYVWSNSSYFNPTSSQVSVDPNYIPKKGDLIYFETMGTAKDGPDHVGVVYDVDESRSIVYCIEGNWNGGKMGRTSYNWKTATNSSGYYRVWGFAHPNYH